MIIMLALMLIAIVVACVFAYRYQKKYDELAVRLDRFMLGKSAENLEEVFVKLKEDTEFLLKENEILNKKLKTTSALARTSFQKAGLVRYNAYNLSGGERSWVLTLLNNYNSGIILNCITGNETSVLYIRPVKEGKSTFKLSKEEVQSLEKAIG